MMARVVLRWASMAKMKTPECPQLASLRMQRQQTGAACSKDLLFCFCGDDLEKEIIFCNNGPVALAARAGALLG